MTILAPVFSLPTLVTELDRPSPQALLDLARLAFAVITGIFLWRVDPRALTILRIYFGATTCIAILGIVFVNMGITHSSNPPLVSMLYGRTLLYVLVWFLYFHSSARVRATFGRNL